MLQRLFFMPLHTGGKIIGWFWSIISFLVIAKMIQELVKQRQVEEDFINHGFHIVRSVFVAFFLIQLISSVLLIVGIKKNSHALLLPWLISFASFLVSIYGLNIYCLCYFVGFKEASLLDFEVLSVCGLIMALSIYMYYGILSLYKHVKATSNQVQSLLK